MHRVASSLLFIYVASCLRLCNCLSAADCIVIVYVYLCVLLNIIISYITELYQINMTSDTELYCRTDVDGSLFYNSGLCIIL